MKKGSEIKCYCNIAAVANDRFTSWYVSLSIVCPMQFRPEDTAASGPSPKVKTKKVESYTDQKSLITDIDLKF